MLKYLQDSNIVIYTMKNRPLQAKKSFLRHHGQMGIFVVTLSALVFGVENSQQVGRNLAGIKTIAVMREVLLFDDKAAFYFGQIRAELYIVIPANVSCLWIIGRRLQWN
ncbi:MAG: hypothetical protein C0403_16010 [Desulfobacterium sp.]|nr:hypothetical protein [Desulfobacterium sp.]